MATTETPGARTGAQFLEGLRGDGREIWLEGERVDDPTTHPKLAGAAHVARARSSISSTRSRTSS